MKKLFFLFVIFLFAGFLNNTPAQTNNVLMEFCTGTWCQYCPCADVIIENALVNHPNTLVLAYHGGSASDPFETFNGNEVITLLGLGSLYPYGVVGRRTGPVDRGVFAGNINSQGVNYPSPLTLRFIKTMDSVSRTVNLTVQATALRDIDTNVFVNFVITEDNIIYSQTGNSGCVGGSNYVHKWVVRNMVNGASGESLSTGHWAQGVVKSKSWTTTLNAGWVWYNCNSNAFAYFNDGNFNSATSYALQTKKMNVNVVTETENNSQYVPENYNLSQNYPNPFNPVTNIHFSIPKDGNVTLKFYDILGNEVAKY